MKITSVRDNYRKKTFEISAGRRTFEFPYAKLRLRPTAFDRVMEAGPDAEFGSEAFTYRLASGKEDTIHLDAVREVNQDAEYLQEVLLHKLTVAASAALASNGIGVRAAARRLGTSTAQVYRLLDPAHSAKSLGQLVALLRMAGHDVDIVIRKQRSA